MTWFYDNSYLNIVKVYSLYCITHEFFSSSYVLSFRCIQYKMLYVFACACACIYLYIYLELRAFDQKQPDYKLRRLCKGPNIFNKWFSFSLISFHLLKKGNFTVFIFYDIFFILTKTLWYYFGTESIEAIWSVQFFSEFIICKHRLPYLD